MVFTDTSNSPPPMLKWVRYRRVNFSSVTIYGEGGGGGAEEKGRRWGGEGREGERGRRENKASISYSRRNYQSGAQNTTSKEYLHSLWLFVIVLTNFVLSEWFSATLSSFRDNTD